jgi:hypothetical protein
MHVRARQTIFDAQQDKAELVEFVKNLEASSGESYRHLPILHHRKLVRNLLEVYGVAPHDLQVQASVGGSETADSWHLL